MAGYDDNNVTMRRKYRKTYDSYCELNELNDSLSSYSSELKTKSLPDLSTSISSDQTSELKQKIDNLQIELNSAHAEIDRLSNENHTLQKQLIDQQNQIDILKKMCYNSTNKQTTSVLRRRRCSQTADISIEISTPKSRFNLLQDKKLKISPKKIKDKFEHLHEKKKTPVENIKNYTKSKHNNLITIIGTQQCKGLSKTLLRLRRNSTYEQYDVTSLIKPNAICTNILTNNMNLHKTNISNNKLVICVGENDTNPVKVLLELSSFLKKYSKTEVIVLSILNNPHLNVSKLNHQLHLICSHYENTTFLNINKYYSSYKPWLNFLNIVSTHINRIIDTIDYENKYICNIINLQHNEKNHKQYLNNKNNSKGKITYYYSKLTTKRSNIITNKQLTILDYYKPLKSNTNQNNNKNCFR